jgi:hypothetical protein
MRREEGKDAKETRRSLKRINYSTEVGILLRSAPLARVENPCHEKVSKPQQNGDALHVYSELLSLSNYQLIPSSFSSRFLRVLPFFAAH